jgi:hypothetical protein
MDCTVVREQLARFGGSTDSALEPATLRHIRACPACLDHQSVEMRNRRPSVSEIAALSSITLG